VEAIAIWRSADELPSAGTFVENLPVGGGRDQQS
jgi:hypothetical protein